MLENQYREGGKSEKHIEMKIVNNPDMYEFSISKITQLTAFLTTRKSV